MNVTCKALIKSPFLVALEAVVYPLEKPDEKGIVAKTSLAIGRQRSRTLMELGRFACESGVFQKLL